MKFLLFSFVFLISCLCFTANAQYGGKAVIFNGSDVKALKSNFKFKSSDLRFITNDTDDPSSVAKTGAEGSLYFQSGTGTIYRKTDSGSSTNWTQIVSSGFNSAIQDADGDTYINVESTADVDTIDIRAASTPVMLASSASVIHYLDSDFQGTLTVSSTPVVTGSGTATEVAYFDASDRVKSSPNLSFDGTQLSAVAFAGDGSNITNVGAAAASALTIQGRVSEAGGITIGQCVYTSGATGQTADVSLCDNTNSAKIHAIGVAAETKTDGQQILVRIGGEITNIDTDGTGSPGTSESWNDGDTVYMATGGNLTNVVPSTGKVMEIAEITYAHSSSGKMITTRDHVDVITVPSGIEQIIRMGDDIGANTVSFRNYSNTEVAYLDSTGILSVATASASVYIVAGGTPLAAGTDNFVPVYNGTSAFDVSTVDQTELELLNGRTTVEPPHRNWLDNADIQINQRTAITTATGATNSTYSIDRWKTTLATTTADIQQVTASQPAALSGSKSLKMIATNTGNGVMGVSQPIEYYTKFNGQTSVTISAWVKSDNADARLVLYSTGAEVASNTHTGGGAWELLQGNSSITAAPSALSLYALIAADTAFGSTTVDTGDYIEISGAKLEIGVYTAFEAKPYGEDLHACQRYYEVGAGTYGQGWSGMSTSGQNYHSFVGFKTTKRAAPTMTFAYGSEIGFPATTNPTLLSHYVDSFVCYMTSDSTNNGAYYNYSWTASAEL